MVSSVQGEHGSFHSNGSIHNSNGTEERLDEFRSLLGKSDGGLLKIVSIGAGAWGSVFAALLQDAYGQTAASQLSHSHIIQTRIQL